MRIFDLEINNCWYEFWVNPWQAPTWCNDYDDWDLCVAVELAHTYFGKPVTVTDWREIEYNSEMEI